MKLSTFLAILIISCSVCMGEENPDPKSDIHSEAKRMFESGRNQVIAGQLMIVGGWLCSFVGSNSLGNSWEVNKVPVFMIIGGTLMMNAGFPVLGYGADRVGRANGLMDTSGYLDEYGWGMYKSSLTMGVFGMGLIFAGALANKDNNGQSGVSALAIGGLVLGLGSAITGIISYVQFTIRSSREIRRAKRNLMSSLFLNPDLFIANNGSLTGSYQVVYKF